MTNPPDFVKVLGLLIDHRDDCGEYIQVEHLNYILAEKCKVMFGYNSDGWLLSEDQQTCDTHQCFTFGHEPIKPKEPLKSKEQRALELLEKFVDSESIDYNEAKSIIRSNK